MKNELAEVVNPEQHTYALQQAQTEPKAAKPKAPPTEKQIETMTQHLCTQWLDGWGAVLKERKTTGDSTAFPKGAWTVGGASRSKPSGVPGIAEVYMDVEAVLHEIEHQEPPAFAVRSVLAHVHRDCVSEDTTGMYAVFEDGTHKRFGLDEFAKNPPVQVKEVIPIIKRVEAVDWEKMRLPVSAGLEPYAIGRGHFLKAVVSSFRLLLIERRGLATLAKDYCERGIVVQCRHK